MLDWIIPETFAGVVTTSSKTVAYPCTFGTGTGIGWHNYSAGAGGIVACRNCGAVVG